MSAINHMLEDPAFKLDTARVREAVAVAEKVRTWMSSNETEARFFEKQLANHMEKCFLGGVSKTSTREKVWGHYHKLRCSDAYKSFWKTLLTIIGCETVDDPIFYQHISHHIFKNALKDAFPLPSSTHEDTPSLSYDEENIIRYVAGYVCNKLFKKLKKSVQNYDLTYGIQDMVEEDDCDIDGSETWLNLVDRGGLCRVSDVTYAAFISMETVVREQLRVDKATELEAGMKEKMVSNVMKSEDVRLQWGLIGVELDEGRSETLLNMIVNEWITLRGFSFAGGYMEIYKQATKQSLQKTKGLRTKLSATEKKTEKKKKKKKTPTTAIASATKQ